MRDKGNLRTPARTA